jgi:hypothetical protein
MATNFATVKIRGIRNNFTAAIVYNHLVDGVPFYSAVRTSAKRYLETTTRRKNMRIINDNGTIIDAVRRYEADSDEPLNTDNNLIYSRQLALSYVMEYLQTKAEFNINLIEIRNSTPSFITGHRERNEIFNNNVNNVNNNIIDTDAPNDITCSICLCDNKEKPEEWVKTRCDHYYHKECLTNWKNNTCPNCRTSIN